MDTGGYRWIQVDTGGYRWIQVDTGGYRWIQVDTGGYRWIQVDTGDGNLESDAKTDMCRSKEAACGITQKCFYVVPSFSCTFCELNEINVRCIIVR